MSDYEETQTSEEEEETTALSDLSPEATEQDSPASTQVEEINSDAEWDTDLEDDGTMKLTHYIKLSAFRIEC